MAFPLQQWARERTSVVRYTHIACIHYRLHSVTKLGLSCIVAVLQVCATYVLARVVSDITE
jgi:hypothetical protein